MRVKAHLAGTTAVAVVNPIQHAPASTAWLAAVAAVPAVTVVAVVVAAMVVAVAAAVALAVVVVVDMAAVAVAVAVRSAADRLYFVPASALVH